MSGGLFALLDDISVLARAAAASIDDVAAASGRASVKAAGVVLPEDLVVALASHPAAAAAFERPAPGGSCSASIADRADGAGAGPVRGG